MVQSHVVRHIFVTGGVASSLGKGLTASSLGMLLKARGLRVTMQKLDPYLNVDPGTMNPFQHGEVFVTDDGAETDLDVGHYERFLSEDLQGKSNVTTGQVYSAVIARERRGGYLGETVQVVPHVTDEIKSRIRALATDDIDCVITEVGGTVGDIESLPFLEAIRQVRFEVGRENCLFVHVSLVPYLAPSGELKTKPTQHSVAALRQVGIQPDAIVCRADRLLPDSLKRKIALSCDVDLEAAQGARPGPRGTAGPRQCAARAGSPGRRRADTCARAPTTCRGPAPSCPRRGRGRRAAPPPRFRARCRARLERGSRSRTAPAESRRSRGSRAAAAWP